jgi:hypothetical protein
MGDDGDDGPGVIQLTLKMKKGKQDRHEAIILDG